MFDSIDFLFGPWLLVEFYKWIMLRWSPRRDKWRSCSCELEDSHLQWWWWNSWNDHDMCIEAEAWDLPKFSCFGIDVPWFFLLKKRETLLMRSWFWWTICLQSDCFYTQPGEPLKHSFRHFLYALEIHDFNKPHQLVEMPSTKTVEDGRSWPQ